MKEPINQRIFDFVFEHGPILLEDEIETIKHMVISDHLAAISILNERIEILRKMNKRQYHIIQELKMSISPSES